MNLATRDTTALSWHHMMIIASVLALLIASAYAVSKARVQNNCSFPIFLSPVQVEANLPITTLQPGKTYQENYRLKMAMAGRPPTGVSIKVSSDPRMGDRKDGNDLSGIPLTQLEYTYDPAMWPDLFYDISDINDHEPRQFCHSGLRLIPDRKTCPTITCPPGCGSFCSQAYNKPDDLGTKACSSDTGITLLLCSGPG